MYTDEPVITHNTPSLSITLFGRQANESNVLHFVQRGGYPTLQFIRPPSGPKEPGFQIISAPRYAARLNTCGIITEDCDGAVVTPGIPLAIRSRDCPLVTIINRRTKQILVCHAGRPALTSQHRTYHFSVISGAMDRIRACSTDPRLLFAHITASICGHHFLHEGPGAEKHLAHFRQRHPSAIVNERGGLDLHRVIREELHTYGVPDENITHDGLCTKSDARLASYRNGDTVYNIAVVIPH